MKKKLISIIAILLILLAVIYIYPQTFKKKYIDNVKEINEFENIQELMSEQKRVEEELNLLSNNKNIDLENAIIIKNPYELTPLSYVIVFNTSKMVEVEIFINDKYIAKTEKNKKHIIPVYGLVDNFENNIKLILSNGEEKVFLITTEDIVTTEFSVSKCEEDIGYLALTGNHAYASAIYNKDGNLVWNFNSTSYVDTIYLENGNMLTTYVENDNTYLLEIDYLGKIYKSYEINNHLHHTFYEYDSFYVLPVYSEDEKNSSDLIYIINKNNGKIEYKVNLLEMLSKYDEQFIEIAKEDPDWAHINSMYLDASENEIIISMRKCNSILSINYVKKSINYIINSTNYFSKKFDNLVIKPDFEMLGQHSINVDKNGNITIFNNNAIKLKKLFERFEKSGGYTISSYPVVFEINQTQKTANLLWKYVYENQKILSPALSNFRILENGYKLINYSCLFNLENGKFDYENLIMKVVILNEKDEIIFEANKEGDSVVMVHNVDIYEFYDMQNNKSKFNQYNCK